MATSDHRQTEDQPRSDEDWVFLQYDGDGVEERVGDAKSEKANLWSAAERSKSPQATEKRTELHTSASNEGSFRSASSDVFRGSLPEIPGMYLFPGFCEPSRDDVNPVRVLRTSVKRFTRVVLGAAVFSGAARFLFWSAAKASEVKRPEMLYLLLVLALMSLVTLLANFVTWYSELRAAETDLNCLSDWNICNLSRYQGFMEILRVLTYIGIMLLAISMQFIYIDVEATWRTLLLHFRDL
ncbi:uncharacterized protein LOC125947289 [Dermacentor silvarum]|uniref:uncharacterized protein LOC125947289 n=1 Tax=Dermacentor silvarum TaxID=543639 RepID=UPI0021012DA9|nr:uncharacterized protein LOC125947289 [Dermacentor silvarum]